MSKISLYYANWCGHCTQFKPEWQKVVDKANQMGIETAAYEHGADAKEVKASGVQSFPTIRITVNGKTSDYNGERTVDKIIGAASGKSGQSGGYSVSQSVGQRGGGQKGGKPIFGDDEDDEYYKMKYLKYKAKYLRLRS